MSQDNLELRGVTSLRAQQGLHEITRHITNAPSRPRLEKSMLDIACRLICEIEHVFADISSEVLSDAQLRKRQKIGCQLLQYFDKHRISDSDLEFILGNSMHVRTLLGESPIPANVIQLFKE